MANKGNTTFGFMLANHPNRFGYYPVMLRITRDRKTKRVKTELEVKKQIGIKRLKATSTLETHSTMQRCIMICSLIFCKSTKTPTRN